MSRIGQLLAQTRAVAIVAMGNLFARWPRALVALVAVMLGVALTTAVTTGYSSARQTILDWNYSWVGHSHVHIQPIPERKKQHGAAEYPFTDPRISAGLADRLAGLDNIKHIASRQREEVDVAGGADPKTGQPISKVAYCYGIDPPTEKLVRDAALRLDSGQMLTAGGEVLLDKNLANALGVNVGDTVKLSARTEAERKFAAEYKPSALTQWLISKILSGQTTPTLEFRVVGLIARPKMSDKSSVNFGLVQTAMVGKTDLARLLPGRPVGLESIDLILNDASGQKMAAAADAVRSVAARCASEHPEQDVRIEVQTADERLAQLESNLRLFRMISRTVAVVALLTAGYIVFTTLGMGMVQRQVELGMLRSVGAGRLQIALVTFAEALPIAALGIVLGLAGGLTATRLVINYYHGFFTQMVIDYGGLAWAGAGGLAAAMLAVALPAWLASRVSPLAAWRPQTRRISVRLDLVLGLVGMVMLGVSFLSRTRLGPWETLDQVAQAYLLVGVPLLFFGYFLVAPLLVATLARVMKYAAALLLWVRPRLLDEQMQTARWRTAANACALMVGISMLVNLGVHSESVISGWKLPTRMPPGFIFFMEEDGINPAQLRRVENLLHTVTDAPQNRRPTPLMAFWIRYLPAGATERRESTEVQFLAGPLERIGDLIQLNFVSVLDGHKPDWAIQRVEGGGAVLATQEFAARFGVRLGGTIRLYRRDVDPVEELTVVGLVESPAINMAIDFLNLRHYFQSFSSQSIIGCVGDANRLLVPRPATPPHAPTTSGDEEIPEQTRIVMFYFGPGAQGPPSNDAGRGTGQARQLEAIGKGLAGINYYAGSLDELREMIVGQFKDVVSILQKIALWAMAIASLGVGFSMAANVQSRRRQLAVLRAIGMTRFQLARQVLAEAVVIALLGSLLGVVHGVNLSINAMYFDRAMFDVKSQLTWQTVQPAMLVWAIGFAILCCLVASLIPAMRAGRTNILAAMRQL